MRVYCSLDQGKQKREEQFFTPLNISLKMADMFSEPEQSEIRCLDPCAGVGNLAAALIGRAENERALSAVTLIERDPTLCAVAQASLGALPRVEILGGDFFDLYNALGTYDRIILNPPYSKIKATERIARLSRDVLGYAEANTYSAFVAFCLRLLSVSGELVAVIPRSFCNGPLFSNFRKLLGDFSIAEIHSFESRKVFWEGKVSQELVIIKVVRAKLDRVRISHENLAGYVTSAVFPLQRIIFENDPSRFIHIPLAIGDDVILRRMGRFEYTVSGLGLKASTGKVVDFRCKDLIQEDEQPGFAPVIYQECLSNVGSLNFISKKKAVKYIRIEGARNLLLPRSNFVLVRRISFKESPRRIVACPLIARDFLTNYFGIENHLNYIWLPGGDLSESLCRGLCAYLSTQSIDMYVRRFSGHTQINASDINALPVPSLEQLEEFSRARLHLRMDLLIEEAEEFFFNFDN